MENYNTKKTAISNESLSDSEALVLLLHAHARIRTVELQLAEKERKIRELESLAAAGPDTFDNVSMLFDLDRLKEINDA